ncbi:hypothetical protein EMCG_05643 [[Emmonsia] crescens]|uniref:Uncharacterized protein n=1 Tax=[Emmonsia] crescens TaxID=73230 RepID=A0A0G2J7T0_9EURO|nr:hypothetical protein EMCG_05643 [Emmonsia crescens UAMH 3008]
MARTAISQADIPWKLIGVMIGPVLNRSVRDFVWQSPVRRRLMDTDMPSLSPYKLLLECEGASRIKYQLSVPALSKTPRVAKPPRKENKMNKNKNKDGVTKNKLQFAKFLLEGLTLPKEMKESSLIVKHYYFLAVVLLGVQ